MATRAIRMTLPGGGLLEAEYSGGPYIELKFGGAPVAEEVINVYDYEKGQPEGILADWDELGLAEQQKVLEAVVKGWISVNEDEVGPDWYDDYIRNSVYGNPGEGTLHKALSEIADHIDYEAEVVEQAADELDELADETGSDDVEDIADAAHDQAEAMEEAAEAVEEASDAARETTAEVFNATGVAQDDQAQGGAGEVAEEAVAGNPGYMLVDDSKLTASNRFKFLGEFNSEDEAKAWAEKEFGVPPDVWGERVYVKAVSGNPSTKAVGPTPRVVEGNPVEDEEYIVIENTPGYMPEVEPADFSSYAEAVEYANELADELEDEGYEVDRGWASQDNLLAIHATHPDKAYDLGRNIEIIRGGNPVSQPEAAPIPASTQAVPDTAHSELVPEAELPAPPTPEANVVDNPPEPSHWYTRPLGKSK